MLLLLSLLPLVVPLCVCVCYATSALVCCCITMLQSQHTNVSHVVISVVVACFGLVRLLLRPLAPPPHEHVFVCVSGLFLSWKFGLSPSPKKRITWTPCLGVSSGVLCIFQECSAKCFTTICQRSRIVQVFLLQVFLFGCLDFSLALSMCVVCCVNCHLNGFCGLEVHNESFEGINRFAYVSRRVER